MNAPEALLAAALEVVYAILNLYIWVLIIGVILSWLVAFGVLNTYNRFVRMAGDFINRITEPLLRPIRRIMPPLGGLDLAPMILIFIILFIQSFIRHLVI